ncbi:MAG: BioY protein [Clostridia bacterium]|nr:BioY protein [Clostridia bacterium]
MSVTIELNFVFYYILSPRNGFLKMKLKFSIKTITFCALFSALIAIGAFIKIPGPLVPFTLQFLFCNLCGMLLGSKKGIIAVLVYIFLGLIGFPIFTQGGGFSYIFQPTFGYIIGFALGVFVIGFITERLKTITIPSLFLASLAGLSAVYIIGLPYYYIITNYYLNSGINIDKLLIYCFLLFLPTDLFVCFISTFLGKRLVPIFKNK